MIEAACTDENGNAYLFSGPQFVLVPKNTFAAENPQAISDQWPHLTDDFKDGIDAALYVPHRGMYFFRGNKYVLASGTSPGSPETLPGDFNGLAGKSNFTKGIDAALYFNDRLYFFIGRKYACLEANAPFDCVEWGDISNKWNGLAGHEEFATGINAAVLHNGHTYFFSGSKYARFEGFEISTFAGGYPKQLPGGWLGLCSEFIGRGSQAFFAVGFGVGPGFQVQVHSADGRSVNAHDQFTLHRGDAIRLRCEGGLEIQELELFESTGGSKGTCIAKLTPGEVHLFDNADAQASCNSGEVTLIHQHGKSVTNEENRYWFGLTFTNGNDTCVWDPEVVDRKEQGGVRFRFAG